MRKSTNPAAISKFSLMVFGLLLLFSLDTAYALDTSTNNTLTPENIKRVLNEAHNKYKDN